MQLLVYWQQGRFQQCWRLDLPRAIGNRRVQFLGEDSQIAKRLQNSIPGFAHNDPWGIKRQYFVFLKEAKRQSEPTIDAAAKALDRFETYTKYRDFRAFHLDAAVAFKKNLAEQKAHKTEKELSKATLLATLTQLRRFFEWLSERPGYKSRFEY